MCKYIGGPKIKQIFLRMNIFVIEYLNIFEYPNLCYTLYHVNMGNTNGMILPTYEGSVINEATM